MAFIPEDRRKKLLPLQMGVECLLGLLLSILEGNYIIRLQHTRNLVLQNHRVSAPRTGQGSFRIEGDYLPSAGMANIVTLAVLLPLFLG